MGLAYQMFLIDQDARLHRLPIRKFEAMLVDADTYPFPSSPAGGCASLMLSSSS